MGKGFIPEVSEPEKNPGFFTSKGKGEQGNDKNFGI